MPHGPEVSLTPVTADSLVELAYASIRESIVTGRFPMGERLVEARIADALGISRAPVREALQRLEHDGLVLDRPRRGTVVREIDGTDFVDIYNARIAIETAAVSLAIRRGASLQAVENAIARLAQAAAEGDVHGTVDAELEVHARLCEASGNAYLAGAFRALSGPIRMALSLDDASYERLADVAAEHVPLLETIRAGDAERAALALHEHIVSSVRPVLARLGGDPSDLLRAPPVA